MIIACQLASKTNSHQTTIISLCNKNVTYVSKSKLHINQQTPHPFLSSQSPITNKNPLINQCPLLLTCFFYSHSYSSLKLLLLSLKDAIQKMKGSFSKSKKNSTIHLFSPHGNHTPIVVTSTGTVLAVLP